MDVEVVVFEQAQYEVAEDIGLNHFALRVCLNVSNLRTQRNVTLSSQSVTAQGTKLK